MAYELTEALSVKNKDVFLPRQFSNSDNNEAHFLSTGPEIWYQLKNKGLEPDAFIAGNNNGSRTIPEGNESGNKAVST
jgi:cysteine synthase A